MEEKESENKPDDGEKDANNPHDCFFRDSFAEKSIAIGAMNDYLPPALLEMADCEHYQVVSESFLDRNLQENIVDVLLSIPMKDNSNIYMYMLLEHQRNPRELMSLRFRQIRHRIFDFHLRKYKTKQLPLIVNVVFYNGRHEWKDKADFYELFGVDPKLAKEVMTAPYKLVDLSQMSEDQELAIKDWWTVMRKVMKHIDAPDFEDLLMDLIDDVVGVAMSYTDRRFFQAMLKYLFSAGNYTMGEGLLEKIYVKIEMIEYPELRRNAMTVADLLREKGIEQGVQKTRRENAINALEMGLELAAVHKITGLSLDALTALKAELKL